MFDKISHGHAIINQHMILSRIQKILLVFMVAMTIFWLWMFLTNQTDGFYNYLYSTLMSIIPILGGIIIISGSHQWKGEGGLIHKGLFFLGLGLVFWGSGCLIWSYYNFFLGTSAPYPSLADVGYAPSVFFYCIGAMYLSRGAGADLGMRKKYATILIISVPVVMFFVCYYFLVTVARAGVLFTPHDPILKTIIDFAYPVGDFISLTASIILSGLYFEFLFKKYRYGIIFVLVGMAVMFIGDFVFSYTTTRSTYYNADFGDLIFTLATFLLSFGGLFFLEPNGQKQYDSKLHLLKFLMYD